MNQSSVTRIALLSLPLAAVLLLLALLNAGPLNANPRSAEADAAGETGAVEPDGVAETAAAEVVYVAMRYSNRIAAVDPATGTQTYTIDVGTAGCSGPRDIALSPHRGTLLVNCADSNRVLLVDIATRALTPVTIDGAAAVAFSADGQYGLIATQWSGELVRLDLATMTTSALSVGGTADALATHPSDALAYVALGNGDVRVFDVTTLAAVATIPVHAGFITDLAVAPDGGRVYTADGYDMGVHVIETATNSVLTTVPFPDTPRRLAPSPDGETIFVTTWGAVHAVDAATLTLGSSAQITNTQDIDIACDGSQLYLATDSFELAVIDTATLTEAMIPLSGSSQGVAACPAAPASGAWLAAAPPAQAAAPGETAGYELALTNLEPAAMTYTLSISATTWPATLSTTSVGPLDPYETQTFTVDIALPADAAWYAVGETLVEATAGDPALGGSIRLETIVYAPPDIAVAPEAVSAALPAGSATTRSLTISNGHGVTTTFELEAYQRAFTPAPLPLGPALAGGPDAFGYIYRDSREGDGPQYEWEEISGSGTALSVANSDDTFFGPLPLGFDFDFYGVTYDELFLSSNGYVTFGSGTGAIPHLPIPDPEIPNNQIALFGGDRYFTADSAVYYETRQNPERFVLQFENVYDWSDRNTARNFELILYPNGNILAQYQSMPEASSFIAGLENADGSVGLPYTGSLSGGLAICYAYPGNPTNCAAGAAPWIAFDPAGGVVGPNSAQTVAMTLDAAALQPGTYEADVVVASDDPDSPAVVAVTLAVEPTATMGQVGGTVTDAWSGEPLTATVRLDDVFTTTASPDYTLWAEAGTYTLQAWAEGYVMRTESVSVIAGALNDADLALEPAQPQLALPVGPVEATAAPGATVSPTLTIANTGPVPLHVTLLEVEPDASQQPPDLDRLDGATILLDVYHNHVSRYYYEALINGLEWQGATVIEMTAPLDAATLEGVDIFWAACCGDGWAPTWTTAEVDVLAVWRQQGGAIFVDGGAGEATTPVSALVDIAYEPADCFDGATAAVPGHPIVHDIDTIHITSACERLVVPPEATVVATDATRQRALLAATTEGAGRVVVGVGNLFRFDGVNQADNRELAANLFAWLATPLTSDVPWLAVSPDTVTVPGHSSADVTVRLMSGELPEGAYEAALLLVHNDPAQPGAVEVPVTLTVRARAIYLPFVTRPAP